jgi:hypothetical protein
MHYLPRGLPLHAGDSVASCVSPVSNAKPLKICHHGVSGLKKIALYYGHKYCCDLNHIKCKFKSQTPQITVTSQGCQMPENVGVLHHPAGDRKVE